VRQNILSVKGKKVTWERRGRTDRSNYPGGQHSQTERKENTEDQSHRFVRRGGGKKQKNTLEKGGAGKANK